jgi:ParB family transcriptional regulator, chromosome partitioning protein
VARPGGLGKGLGALIPAEAADAEGPGSGLEDISISALRPNPLQPRAHFDEEALSGLADSIREVGVLQPVLVRPVDGGFELIAGERRWRAAKRAGLRTIPCLVRSTDDATSLEQALVENVQREGLNALEEAAAYQQLIEDFSLTHEEVGARVGRSRTTITNTLRLLQLPPAIQRMVREGQLREGHARALLGTPDRAFQEALARRAVGNGMSVRAVEDEVRAHLEAGGTDGEPAATATIRRLRPPGLLELEEMLGDFLETRVKVAMGGKRGRVTIEFSDLEDLERIYRLMAEPMPEVPSGMG